MDPQTSSSAPRPRELDGDENFESWSNLRRLSSPVEHIAHYRILRRIGRGGMGIVFRARDERDGREVALKVIRGAEAAGDESAPHVNEARQRFAREAEILRGLLHVNIVSFLEIGEEDGTPYLAMEFLEGVPIGSFAGRPFTETLPLLVQAAHGMEYLASRGIVHRDLSPDNVFVIERGGERIVKLLDFGVAKLFEAPTGLESLTATGFFLGKVAYGSPEQLGSMGHGAPLDWRSDVYTLGVIFYQVLAGRRPFEGKVPVEYIAAHLNVVPPPVAAPADSPKLPMELVRLIGQMLEKKRDARPKSYREIVDRLVAILRQSGGPVAVDALPAVRDGTDHPTGVTELVDASDPSKKHTLTGVAVSAVRSPLGRLALGLVFLASLLTLLLVRTFDRKPSRVAASNVRPPAASPPPTEPESAAAATSAAPGALQILATPWARILSVTAIPSGKPVVVEADATTPYLLTGLSAGTYRVVLACAANGQLATQEVAVKPGRSALLSQPFSSPSALAETLR